MSADKQLRVMIMAGGTGGHLLPVRMEEALRPADTFSRSGSKLANIGSHRQSPPLRTRGPCE